MWDKNWTEAIDKQWKVWEGNQVCVARPFVIFSIFEGIKDSS